MRSSGSVHTSLGAASCERFPTQIHVFGEYLSRCTHAARVGGRGYYLQPPGAGVTAATAVNWYLTQYFNEQLHGTRILCVCVCAVRGVHFAIISEIHTLIPTAFEYDQQNKASRVRIPEQFCVMDTHSG